MNAYSVTNKFNNQMPHRLSMRQQALWFIHSLDGFAQSAYNEPLVFSLKGYLSLSALKDTFRELIERHAILRASFEKESTGNIVQVLNREVDESFAIIEDISNSQLNKYIFDEVTRPFDLKKAPLLRFTLIKLTDTKFILIIVQHHIITDGISSTLLIKELSRLYNKKIRNESIQEDTHVRTYFNYIIYEENMFASESYRGKVDLLADVLKDYPGLNFLTTPTCHKEADIFSGDRVFFEVDKSLYSEIKDFSKSQRITLFSFLFSVYCIFASKYTRSKDIIIGVPFANRGSDPECRMLGYFSNVLPVRIKLDTCFNFMDLIASVSKVILMYLSKQEVVFEHIASKLNLQRKPWGQHPLIQTMFVWTQDVSTLNLNFTGVEALHLHDYFPKSSKFDISLFMSEKNKEQIIAYFEFRENLFEREIIEKFSRYFVTLARNILKNPNQSLLSLSMLDDAEKIWMKENFFKCKLDREVKTSLPFLFSETANRYKRNKALVFADRDYTYSELESISNRWAYYIKCKYKQNYGKDILPNTLIGLCIDRHEDMIFGMLGILKAGAAYMPIDPRYPKERINYMLRDSNVSLLLTHQIHSEIISGLQANLIIYMDDNSIKYNPEFENHSVEYMVLPKDLAYVLYTSGSTGKPKGVLVSHENIICLFESLKKVFDLSEKDVWSLFHTYCFDISVWEIWGAFLFGGKLVIVPYETSRDPKQFYHILTSNRVTVLTQTASAFQMLVKEDRLSNKKLESLRYVVFVGESLKVSILRPWVEKYGTEAPRLVNMYGITETTVYTNYKFLTQKDIDKGRDNIGWPLEEFSMCIMDENLHWCPVGVVGEICIGGRGLSRGYLNKDELTHERFIPDPYTSFLGIKDARLYRTGDLGRWMEDGSIEYLGRKDFQIKLRGFRIELGEVETAIGSFKNISHVSVILKGDGEIAYLAAFYTTESKNVINISDLILHLKSFLPDYMIPKKFVQLSSFPMTVNGKIDKQALRTLDDKIFIADECNQSLKTPLDHLIATIWANILNLEVKEISLLSNFFDLGGNSLLAVKMLSLVSKEIGKDLSLNQFMGIPNIATLSAQAEETIKWYVERLKKDIVLNPDIQPLHEENPYLFNPRSIFLTGATGFLGAHILHELLANTSAKIYCLVRSSTCAEALEKINDKSRKYGLSSHKSSNRVVPILGDLAQEKLGLSQIYFELIASEIDAIYHVGAQVHHIFDYGTLYRTNVQSTLELIKIATHQKNKAFHFISTLGTQHISPIECLSKNEENRETLNFNGYLTTKWVSEKLLEEAFNRGIAVQVYRPGNIVMGERGVDEPEMNHILLRLKGILQLGKAYIDDKETLEMVPVDILAAMLVKISGKLERFSYNLHNTERLSWLDYLEFAKDIGYPILLLEDEKQWKSVLQSLDESNALYKLLLFYNAPTTRLKILENDDIQPDYLLNTPSYKEMIEKQLSSLIKSGFLPKPKKSVEYS